MASNVTVYSTQMCPYCHKAKEYLDEKGIKYKDIDVSENQEAANEMIKISGQMGVPIIVVDKEVIVGFDKAKLDQLLG